MKTCRSPGIRWCACRVVACPMAITRTAGLSSAPERVLATPNYDLAGRWTSAKVGKMVYGFTTAVTPHWLEFSDRFWYSYETPSGMRWWMVDSDQEDQDAALGQRESRGTADADSAHTPYDAQHLPATGNLRFFDNDTKIRFSVTLPA